MALTARALAAVLRLPKLQVEVTAWVLVEGIRRGYSFSNIAWIVKQSAHETGFWSNLGTQIDNNVFGMSCVQKRETTQTGCRAINDTEDSGLYPNIRACVIDRYLWDDYWSLVRFKRSVDYGDAVSSIYHASNTYGGKVSGVIVRRLGLSIAALLIAVPLEVWLLFVIIKKTI